MPKRTRGNEEGECQIIASKDLAFPPSRRDHRAAKLNQFPTTGNSDHANAPTLFNGDSANWPTHFPPATGPIDLDKYDLPQHAVQLEWWYYNCHVTSKRTGQQFSLFTSFFRQAVKGETKTFVDACTWAICDVENKEYYSDSLLDRYACEAIVQRLDPAKTGKKCTATEGPLLGLARQGRLPKPDRPMKAPAVVATDRLSLCLDKECTLTRRDPQPTEHVKFGAPRVVYDVSMVNPHRNCAARLSFVPQQSVMRHGTNGIVNHMFYYYIPRCAVHGTITVEGVEHEVEGSGWYDREFGGTEDDTGREALDAWMWFAVQLDDASEFTLFNVVDRENKIQKSKFGVLTDALGTRTSTADVDVTGRRPWTSLNTFIEYPTEWTISAPALGLELELAAEFPNQEFCTVLVEGGGFFEGRLTVRGTRNGVPVKGTAFLERKCAPQFKTTGDILKGVGKLVRNVLAEMYPLNASQEWVDDMVLGRQCTGKGATAAAVCDTLFRPVRALTDRGGKAWRSLILVSSINAIAKRHIDCRKYIAMAELLHVGSLVIDDIEDESVVRRGGRCVHLDYGTATAINAGTACFFMAPLGFADLPDDKRLKVYELYFDMFRAGHAGQGLDIRGLDHLMPAAIETGETQELLDSLQAIHVYKTGGAAATLCRMACVVADATDEQAAALENYGRQIGLAFQIVDDALNLRGFEGELKEVGEDIRDGKVTYPIIAAIGKLGRADREYVWGVLKERTSDPVKIAAVIAKLNTVGAIEECLVEARELVETAWARLDKVLDDSLPKITMRCFAEYLTERTY